MINKIYLITMAFLMVIGGEIYLEDHKRKLKNKVVLKISYVMMSLSLLMMVIYIIFFTTDGLYGPLP